MDFLQALDRLLSQKKLSPDVCQIIRSFFSSYYQGIKETNGDLDAAESILNTYLKFILEQYKTPYQFPSYHPAEYAPIDYAKFGLDFFDPLIDRAKSEVKNSAVLSQMEEKLARKENIILFANHQVEPDPQLIILMLREKHPKIAKDMIFVAGHRVTTDPFAIPFSLGCNLLCIYSKKHIEFVPELKEERLLHNRRTMSAMKDLLAEGGKCIFVAPSGGRDRFDAAGNITVAPFDPQSIEMFRLVAKQSKVPAHFYPLALSTGALSPAPIKRTTTLAEPRTVHYTPIKLSFGEELFLDTMPAIDGLDKHQCREMRGTIIWETVNHLYQQIR